MIEPKRKHDEYEKSLYQTRQEQEVDAISREIMKSIADTQAVLDAVKQQDVER